MDSSNRTLDIDFLTASEKRQIKAELAYNHLILLEHDCSFSYKGYCSNCSQIYIKLHELEKELHFRG